MTAQLLHGLRGHRNLFGSILSIRRIGKKGPGGLVDFSRPNSVEKNPMTMVSWNKRLNSK
jgi:hypothetical protein